VGHTGTLDPFATGLLVVLVGRATRLARFVEQQAKTYLATAHLGVTTTTDDLHGAPIEGEADGSGARPERAEVEAALAGFLGAQRQRPPAFSAKRVDGERSYAKARRGELLDLAEVEIVVEEIELVAYDFPVLQFRTRVSPGTYIRAIARDLGVRLGTGAHLTALRREAIGALRVEAATPLDQVGPATPLQSPLAAVAHLPRIAVTAAEVKTLGYGQAVRTTELAGVAEEQPVLAVADADRLVAIGRVREQWFHPEVVLEAAS
jgi:tRNA pseudouridine55 synthase